VAQQCTKRHIPIEAFREQRFIGVQGFRFLFKAMQPVSPKHLLWIACDYFRTPHKPMSDGPAAKRTKTEVEPTVAALQARVATLESELDAAATKVAAFEKAQVCGSTFRQT
jgi:hypothetical protein